MTETTLFLKEVWHNCRLFKTLRPLDIPQDIPPYHQPQIYSTCNLKQQPWTFSNLISRSSNKWNSKLIACGQWCSNIWQIWQQLVFTVAVTYLTAFSGHIPQTSAQFRFEGKIVLCFLTHLLGHLFALQQAGSLHSQHSFIQSCAEAVGEGHKDCALLLQLDRVASFNLQSSHNYKSTQGKKIICKTDCGRYCFFNPIKKGK